MYDGSSNFGPSYIYGDNMPIIHNMQCLESTLRRNQMISATMQFVNQFQWVKAELVMFVNLKTWLIFQPI